MEDEMNELAASAERYTAADQAREDAYNALVESIAKALLAGAQPADVARVTPFSAAWVRQLARAKGVPKAPAGRRPSGRTIPRSKKADNG